MEYVYSHLMAMNWHETFSQDRRTICQSLNLESEQVRRQEAKATAKIKNRPYLP